MEGVPSTAELLEQLSDVLLPTWKVGWRWRARPSKFEYERRVSASQDVLGAIRRTGDWRAVPASLYVLAHDNAVIRDAGARTIAELAGLIPIGALPGFEGRLRQSTLQAYSWNDLDVKWFAEHAWPLRVWALLTMHPSGFVRDAALRRLVSAGDRTLAMPYLLLRVNDWVGPVRSFATEAVRSVMATGDATPWIPVLGLLDQLRVRSRADHAWLLDGVTRLLLRPESRPDLVFALGSEDRAVARWAFGAAMGLPDAERGGFIRRAMESVDPVVRLRGAKAARACTVCPGREELLERMASDHFMPVRREALYAGLEGEAGSRRALLCASLLDRHASMRHAARVYLRELPGPDGEPFDARAFYHHALAGGEPGVRAAAIAGIGECGDQADADVVAACVAERHPRIAGAAVRAVAALDRGGRIAWFVERLQDDRPAVAREAGRALMLSGGAAPAEPIREVFRGDSRAHSRRLALRILLRRHPYDAAVDAVVAAGSGDPALVEAALDFIERVRPWSVSYGPSDAQRKAVRLAFVGLPRPLSERLSKKLCAFMGLTRLE